MSSFRGWNAHLVKGQRKMVFVRKGRARISIASLLANTLFVSSLSILMSSGFRFLLHADDDTDPKKRAQRVMLSIRLSLAMFLVAYMIVRITHLKWEFSFLGIHNRAELVDEDEEEEKEVVEDTSVSVSTN